MNINEVFETCRGKKSGIILNKLNLLSIKTKAKFFVEPFNCNITAMLHKITQYLINLTKI